MKQYLTAFILCFIFSTVNESQAQDIYNSGATAQVVTKKKKGYFNSTQAALLMGTLKVYKGYASITEFQVSPSVTMTNGYMFNEHWAMGAGIGIEIFDCNFFPVFADIRYTFSDNKVSPFLAFKTGYAFCDFKTKHYDKISFNFPPYDVSDADVRYYGGFLLNPEVGVSISLNDNSDLLFTVAYNYRKTKTRVTTETNIDDYYNMNKWVNKAGLDRLSFGVAIMFR